MIDDLDTRRAGPLRRQQTRAELPRLLREAAADRVPVPFRGRPVPWRAAVVALVLAVLLSTAMLARAQTARDDVGGTVIPARAAAPSPVPGTARAPLTTTSQRPGPSGSAAGPGQAGSSLGSTALLVVHVVGRVRRPGLVTLQPGGRVWDAVSAAGGPVPGARLDRINLARPLADGEQLLVPGASDPVPQPPAAAPGGGAGRGPAAPGALVDLNTATQADLDGLPGVGPVLAGRITAWRDQHGRFSRVEELGEIAGIGDKLLGQLRPLVRV